MKFTRVRGPSNNHLFKPIGKDTYWVKFERAGRGRLERSLKTNEIGLARIRRDEAIAKFLGERPKHLGKALLVDEKFEQFVELKKIKAKGTYVGIKGTWELHLKPYFGGMLVQDVNETEWLK
jgi:hypothetical protein